MRRRLNLNRDWRFVRADRATAPFTGIHSLDFDDSSWEPVGLPHSFDLPYFRTPEFYVGEGWYRKRFDVSETLDQRFLLEFEGVFQHATVFVNGMEVGGHQGGYTAFALDITRAVRPGTNLLAVRVDNLWNPRLAPRAGEHIFPGGIYRDVHLTITDPVHVTWCGSAVTTPHISATSATVSITTVVTNDSDAPTTIHVRTHLIDQVGKRLETLASSCRLEPRETASIAQTSRAINDPQLWHPDHPNLYIAHTFIFDDHDGAPGPLLDETKQPFGIRWFEWTADRGFFLNGEHLYLRGANLHQDHAGWGIAITQSAIRRDLQLMKGAGFNFVRGSHYPHHAAFARLCDEIGLLMWSENTFWGKGGFGPEGYWNASAYPVNEVDFAPFEESCRLQLREMIHVNRNSPSIVGWNMTNEAFFTFHLDRAKALIAGLVKLSKELDPTRPAAIGGAQRGDVDKLGDIAGYNGDGARLFIDPGVPSMVSEYGAISKPHAAYEPFFGDKQIEQFSWRSGEAIWAGFDYGSIAGRQGLKGIVDHFRLPKRSWHWYRNANLGIAPPAWPVDGTPAKLTLETDTRRATINGTDATDDCQLIVTVRDATGRHLSNSPSITLTIESGPGEFPTGPSITFASDSDIQITEGRAAIALRSYHAGETLVRATSPGLEDATITVTTIGDAGENFIPGVTPTARPRPYTPPPESPIAKAAMHNAVNVALNRPSRASDEDPAHPARHANDGDASTFWSAAPNPNPQSKIEHRKSKNSSLTPSPDHPLTHSSAYWHLDLEGFYQLASLKLIFPTPARHRFTIETTTDLNASEWRLAIDRRETTRTDAVRNDVFPPGLIARYVRVIFEMGDSSPTPALSVVELFGILSTK